MWKTVRPFCICHLSMLLAETIAGSIQSTCNYFRWNQLAYCSCFPKEETNSLKITFFIDHWSLIMAYSHHIGSGLEVVQGTEQAQTKQWVLVPAPISDQYEHFCRIYIIHCYQSYSWSCSRSRSCAMWTYHNGCNFSRNTIRLTETIVAF